MTKDPTNHGTNTSNEEETTSNDGLSTRYDQIGAALDGLPFAAVLHLLSAFLVTVVNQLPTKERAETAKHIYNLMKPPIITKDTIQ